ncbi:MAG TPA: type II toxin-antitoxin system VapC family toxin [Chthonomonadaceae bacterium]|nr:type II toxin-antitoxin system VapC family toxin [Chthonomonadaceae bacterium]
MTIVEAMRGVTRVFLDTAPVIYFVERISPYHAVVNYVFDRLDAGTLKASTSPITLAECLIGAYQSGDTELQFDFYHLITRGPSTVCGYVDYLAGRQAAELRAKYGLSLTDALQLAMAMGGACEAFLTNDIALKRVTEVRVLVLQELEAPSE